VQYLFQCVCFLFVFPGVEVIIFYYNLVCSMKKSPEAVAMASVKQVSLEIWKRDSFYFYL